MKYLVSQNYDGLHRRSGRLPDKISELHGNNNREICKDCGKECIRNFRAVADDTKSIHDHRTGRKCTLINFTESLPEREVKLAFDHAKKADLCLVLGSSLTVTPANEISEAVGKRRRRGAKLVICNLQGAGNTVKLANNRRVLKAEPFAFDLRGDAAEDGMELRMELEFMGHYGEPNLELIHSTQKDELTAPAVYLLEYSPSKGEWKVIGQ